MTSNEWDDLSTLTPREGDMTFPCNEGIGGSNDSFINAMERLFEYRRDEYRKERVKFYRCVWFTKNRYGSRFLKLKAEDGKWYELGDEAIFENFNDYYMSSRSAFLPTTTNP
jgi:hypothetical protein